MKVWVSKDQGVSHRTGKQVKIFSSTSVRDRTLNCIHVVVWKDFLSLVESNHHLLETKESLFIKRDNLPLNWTKYSQKLFLF